MDKRATDALCQQCGGDGVVKISGGISVCPGCDGNCWAPSPRDEASSCAENAEADVARLTAALQQAQTWHPIATVDRTRRVQVMLSNGWATYGMWVEPYDRVLVESSDGDPDAVPTHWMPLPPPPAGDAHPSTQEPE